MPKKAYTMKEMKTIVDYLKERRLYNEIRGRKMWTDLANANIVDRTWQSLKETFLKRILPDIHNPYYKLTVAEISSFRQEYDVEARNANRLEIHTVSEDSNSDNHSAKRKNTSSENKKTGEDNKLIDINNRSSTETLVLENCYETAEDVRKELESPGQDKDPPKSIRDLITYSEPLTPMLQELLDDFDTDDEEPRLQIVEAEPVKTEAPDQPPESPKNQIRESQSYDKATIVIDDDDDDNDDTTNKTNQKSKIKSLKLKKTHKGTWENKEPIQEVSSTTENETHNNETKNVFAGANGSPKPNVNGPEENNASTINGSNDTELPNNQEELANNPNHKRNNSTESNNSEFLEPQKKHKKSRKRSRSPNSADRRKKSKSKSKSRESSASREKDTQTFDSHPQTTDLKKKTMDNSKDKDNEETNERSEQNVESTVGDPNEGTSQEAGPSGANDKSEDVNPCLQSVSLYAEQFSQSQYSDSEEHILPNNTQAPNKSKDDDNIEKPEEPKQIDTKKSDDGPNVSASQLPNNESTDKSAEIDKSKLEQMILLHSHSDSESENPPPLKKKRTNSKGASKSMEKALANAFGFSSGGMPCKRPRKKLSTSYRYSRHRNNSANLSVSSGSASGSGSSERSGSDSERRPHCRHDKYVKPPTYDILNNPEGRGLFVVGHKRLLPILENGELHYLCGRENIKINGEQRDSYWKEKYLEEKKKYAEEKIRADELARLLRQAKENELIRVPSSPILQSAPSGSTLANTTKPEPHEAPQKENCDETKIKIKFSRNKDIELEGQWAHMTPVLEKMVALFKSNEPEEKPTEAKTNPKEESSKTEPTTVESRTNITEKPKPVEKDLAQDSIPPITIKDDKTQSSTSKDDKSEIDENSNKKKNEKKNANTSTKEISNKQNTKEVHEISSGKSTPIVNTVDPDVHEKINKLESEIFKQIEEIDKTDPNVTKRKRGRPRKVSTMSLSGVSVASSGKESTSNKMADQLNKRIPKAPRRYDSDSGIAVPVSALRKRRRSLSTRRVPFDDTARYMLPPPPPPAPAPAPAPARLTRHTKARSYNTRATSEDSCSIPDSTQGYQDSDVSPPTLKRKKKSSGQLRRVRRKSSYLADEDTSQSNDSTNSKSIIPNATLNSEVYRSESYNNMFVKERNFGRLDKIDESPVVCAIEKDSGMKDSLTINVNNEFYIPLHELRYDVSKKSSEANSSNVSLPLSPELSVVESLSVSRDTISIGPENHPTLNELQADEVKDSRDPATDCNKYLMNDIDVTVPLMEQDCELQILNKNTHQDKNTKSAVNKIRTPDIEEDSLSDSLDRKLRDLLLESAKKIAKENMQCVVDKENVMEVDVVETDKKARAKKRCSTPRKKKTVVTSKTPIINPVLEEHTESCSKGGRRSCPPVISVIPCTDVPINDETMNVNPNVTRRGRKKKDIIKVKILRPRDKSGSRDRARSSLLSLYTDSGINETGSSEMCKTCNISTELIHNHSDTCLHLDECIGDSVEFIKSATKSIISLDSNSVACDSHSEEKICAENDLTPEMFCTNAQDATSFDNCVNSIQQNNHDDAATVYHTPPSNTSYNSLLTEDLSDEASPKPSKWYLLMDQETNFKDIGNTNTGGMGSNLAKIFPITCTVPDLSTITEQSKDGDSKPPNSDTEKETASNKSIFSP